MELVLSGYDVVDKKINEVISDHDGRELVMYELKARGDGYRSLNEAVSELAGSFRTIALIQTIVWLLVFLLFFSLLVIKKSKGSQ